MTYMLIEHELEKRRKQIDSVRGIETPFRVEFRFPGGTKHFQYFANLPDAQFAEDSSCSYSPNGKAIIQRPISSQIQKRGPWGGWKKVAR
jgi:hypothetical protein